jgi:hypothetical protein
MKLLFWRRNYRDADPIRFYCDTPSPDNTLRCVDELGHLGWCINGETSWRDDAWNVDHWDNTEEAPPVESETTMSATEWVRLESTLKPEPGPQDTPNDRDPLSAAWLRGYHRDRNRAATPPGTRLTQKLGPLPVFSCSEVDCRNPAHRNRAATPPPQVETVKSDLRYRAEEAAAVVVLAVLLVLTFIGVSRYTAASSDKPISAAATAAAEQPTSTTAKPSEPTFYRNRSQCFIANPTRYTGDCIRYPGPHPQGGTDQVWVLGDGIYGPRYNSESGCLEAARSDPTAEGCRRSWKEGFGWPPQERAWVIDR